MHLNSCVIIGRVSPKGPALRYTESGVPWCSFVLEVDELSKAGEVFTTFIPCEITGKYAEQTSVEVEAGDVLQISGKWKYKSSVDPKTGAKVSKPIVSSWGITQRQPATTDPDAATDTMLDSCTLHTDTTSVPETHKGTPRDDRRRAPTRQGASTRGRH